MNDELYCKCGMYHAHCRCDEESDSECACCGYPGTWAETAGGRCPACRDTPKSADA